MRNRWAMRRVGGGLAIALGMQLLFAVVAPLAGATVTQAIDKDSENKIYLCGSNRDARVVGFGEPKLDKARCFTFRFAVPAGGIKSAVLYASILSESNGDTDTDSVLVGTGDFGDKATCDPTPMPGGCVVVHGGFRVGEKSLVVDLLNLPCDAGYRSGGADLDKKRIAAILAQLNTGVFHGVIQDDTTIFSAQLVLNEGSPTKCGTTTDPVPPNIAGNPPATTCTSTGATKPTPAFGSPEPMATTCMTLQAGQRNVIAGQTEWVPIWMSNGADVANINFDIAYDAGVAVAQTGLGRGSFFASALGQGNTQTAGIVRIGIAQTAGENGSGTIAWIKFRAVGPPGSKTPLRVTVTTINDPGGKVLTIDRIDGLVQIVGPDGLLPGDCDGGGSLTEADALCALQMSVQLVPVRLNLDMDKDGNVTSRDSTIILQKAVGRA